MPLLALLESGGKDYRRQPNSLALHALALMSCGRRAAAQADCILFESLIRATPARAINPEVAMMIAAVYGDLSDYNALIKLLWSAYSQNPHHREVANALTWSLATLPDKKIRKGKVALSIGEGVCRDSGWKDPGVLDSYSVAAAESGDWNTAIRWQQTAIAIATRQSDNRDLLPALQEHLSLFRSHLPCRDKPKGRSESTLTTIEIPGAG